MALLGRLPVLALMGCLALLTVLLGLFFALFALRIFLLQGRLLLRDPLQNRVGPIQLSHGQNHVDEFPLAVLVPDGRE